MQRRFRQRPDSEHEMVLNRLVIGLLIEAYFVLSRIAGSPVAPELLVFVTAYLAVAIAIFAHLVARPGVCATRRVIAICIDLGALSYVMQVGGELATFFYPIYLWIILGNGFRFGLAYLFFAMTVAVCGFLALIATNVFWHSHLHLALGLLFGLIVLPTYASTLIRKLFTALNQAEQASRAKSLFLASVSHELRTPLNAIIGLSDLLKGLSPDPEQQDMVCTIGTAGRSLLTLINSILDLSRIESGRMPSNIVEFDLHALVTGVKALLAVQARTKGLRLSAHITTRTPWLLKGDRHHLEEILTNLTANAVKFTATGHVVISVDAVEQDSGTTKLRFEISDTGIGIAPEAQKRIFERFSQADETIVDRFGGTGLGLAIVKQLVEMQGGSIGVESTPGAGSTFWFEITFASKFAEKPAIRTAQVIVLSAQPDLEQPLRALGVEPLNAANAASALALLVETSAAERPAVIVDESLAGTDLETVASDILTLVPVASPILLRTEGKHEPPPESLRALFVTTIEQPIDAGALAAALRIAESRVEPNNAEERAERHPDRSLSILVAEDNRTNQKVIAKILERHGHRVRIAENGELALDALEQHPFDLVLMDINMPVMNGLEAAKLYRFISLGSERRVPIVALTADATPEVRSRCEEAGMDACLTKPIEPARLLETIASLVPAGAGTAETLSTPESVSSIDAQAAPAGSEPVIDQSTLDALAELGGKEFVDELVGQFVGDAAGVLRDLAVAAREGNAQSFREQAHALRSAAANIGAKRIYEICLSWRQLPTDELERNGAQYLERLRAEFDQVRTALRDHLPAKASAAAPLRVIRGGRDTALAS